MIMVAATRACAACAAASRYTRRGGAGQLGGSEPVHAGGRPAGRTGGRVRAGARADGRTWQSPTDSVCLGPCGYVHFWSAGVNAFRWPSTCAACRGGLALGDGLRVRGERGTERARRLAAVFGMLPSHKSSAVNNDAVDQRFWPSPLTLSGAACPARLRPSYSSEQVDV